MHRFSHIQLWIHLITWLIIFSMPVWSMSTRGFHMDIQFWGTTILLPSGYLILFYLNYSLLIKRLLFSHKTAAFFFLNILIIGLIVLSTTLLKDLFIPFHPQDMTPPPPRDPRPRGGMPFFFHTMMLVSVVGVSVALRMTTKWYADTSRIQELEREKSEAELQQLKSQLNPHFLFNSLNNIYALVQFDQTKAQTALHSLSDLLRYQLYEANQERLSLTKEIAFVQSYCSLMQLRVPKQCSISIQMDAGDNEVRVAPLLFIALVENAFKHGIHPSEPSFIDIQIRIDKDQSVICRVTNSANMDTSPKGEKCGIGLENLKRRLILLYPDSHQFSTECKDHIFTAQIILFHCFYPHANSLFHN